MDHLELWNLPIMQTEFDDIFGNAWKTNVTFVGFDKLGRRFGQSFSKFLFLWIHVQFVY